MVRVQEQAVSTPGHLRRRWCYSSPHCQDWCQRSWRRFWKGRQGPVAAESRVLRAGRGAPAGGHSHASDTSLGLYPSQASHSLPPAPFNASPTCNLHFVVIKLLCLSLAFCTWYQCLNLHHFNQGILQLLDISIAAHAIAPCFFLAGELLNWLGI